MVDGATASRAGTNVEIRTRRAPGVRRTGLNPSLSPPTVGIGEMTVPGSALEGDIRLMVTRTLRDHRVGLAHLVAGIALTAGLHAFEVRATSARHYPAPGRSGVLLSAIGGIGFPLTLRGAIFTGINESLLRKSGRAV